MEKKVNTADVALLQGCEIDQICIGRYQLVLNCSSKTSISIESQIEHKVVYESSAILWIAGEIPSVIQMQRLLGTVIQSALVNEKGHLVIVFSNGDTLTAVKRKDGLESYQVTAANFCFVQ